jgi:hypothetical protein
MEEHKLERMDSNLVCVEETGEEVQLNTSRKDALLSVRTEDMIGRRRQKQRRLFKATSQTVANSQRIICV